MFCLLMHTFELIQSGVIMKKMRKEINSKHVHGQDLVHFFKMPPSVDERAYFKTHTPTYSNILVFFLQFSPKRSRRLPLKMMSAEFSISNRIKFKHRYIA